MTVSPNQIIIIIIMILRHVKRCGSSDLIINYPGLISDCLFQHKPTTEQFRPEGGIRECSEEGRVEVEENLRQDGADGTVQGGHSN